MEKINEIYQKNCNINSDINEHLPTLLKYANECDHITEMGVRWVSSTWPFLLSNPKKMISYDIVKNDAIHEVISLSKENNIDYEFIESDVLKIEIEPTELLFIDTLHTYNQLYNELLLHSEKVSKYIILHDTVSFGIKDESIYQHASDIVKNIKNDKEGLTSAIEDFLQHEKGKFWEIKEIFTNNNGLTILKRK
jgi:hypothetical protein